MSRFWLEQGFLVATSKLTTGWSVVSTERTERTTSGDRSNVLTGVFTTKRVRSKPWPLTSLQHWFARGLRA